MGEAWRQVVAKDLIDSPVVVVDAESTVEDACDLLLSKDLACLAVNSRHNSSPHGVPYHGLFDYADVNAFLTLAATRHRISAEELREKPRIREILAAAKAGRVPVYLVSDLSEKNPLEILPHDATLVSLLGVFARGTHRVLIQSPPPSSEYLGMVSDRRLLAWFTAYAQETPSLLRFLSVPLSSLALPSLYLYMTVVAAKASDSVLDAMKLMSDEGVSSVAVVDDETGNLLSAVSVTDIGKIVVPAQSNQILSTVLQQLVSRIKERDGSTDGADKFPVYSVSPSNTLFYTMQKLLATNSHRLFVTEESPMSSSSNFNPGSSGSLCGIVSTVDVLSLFARMANLPDVDPKRMQRHRRASSTSSQSSGSWSSGDFGRSRSSSRTSLQRMSASMTNLDSFQWAERVQK
ncbi:Protein SDS23 [Grifola frondosa]|uniref:Protein SDS23 n=1 Tax=Grifola frondosa TaxID=5627 RepID=A0A1C7LSF5_GRIFR|nr:Protein SDS23 [Grifola frondosa]